jgi:hypothetical protein
MNRLMQRGDEDHAAQPQSIGARGGVRHRLKRTDQRRRTKDLLERPRALEPELLGSSQVGTKARWFEPAVLNELRDRDRPTHTPKLPVGHLSTATRHPCRTANLPTSTYRSALPASTTESPWWSAGSGLRGLGGWGAVRCRSGRVFSSGGGRRRARAPESRCLPCGP